MNVLSVSTAAVLEIAQTCDTLIQNTRVFPTSFLSRNVDHSAVNLALQSRVRSCSGLNAAKLFYTGTCQQTQSIIVRADWWDQISCMKRSEAFQRLLSINGGFYAPAEREIILWFLLYSRKSTVIVWKNDARTHTQRAKWWPLTVVPCPKRVSFLVPCSTAP